MSFFKSLDEFIIICMSFLSCQEKKDVKTLISGERGFKYWKFIESDPIEPISIFVYFDKNGKRYAFVKDDELFYKIDTPYDVIPSNTWNLKNDSILSYGPYDDLKISVTKDSLFVDTKTNKILYIAAPDSLIPKEFLRILD